MASRSGSVVPSQLAWGLGAIAVALVLIGAVLLLEKRGGDAGEPPDDLALTKPIRIELLEDGGFAEFVNALRVYHYRVQARATAEFQDLYYDTEDWKLYERGYSYRFRTEDAAGTPVAYSLRIEQERRFLAPDAKKLEIDSALPDPIGAQIQGGNWQRALLPIPDVKASNRLHALLRKLEIDPAELRPRLIAELYRERFDVTDKGRNWFQLDHEIWRCRLVEQDSRSATYEDVVIDTRLKRSHPEIVRRVSTMQLFSDMVDGTQLADRAPHERAIAALSGR